MPTPSTAPSQWGYPPSGNWGRPLTGFRRTPRANVVRCHTPRLRPLLDPDPLEFLFALASLEVGQRGGSILIDSSPSMGWERWIGMLSIPQSVQNGQFLRSLSPRWGALSPSVLGSKDTAPGGGDRLLHCEISAPPPTGLWQRWVMSPRIEA